MGYHTGILYGSAANGFCLPLDMGAPFLPLPEGVGSFKSPVYALVCYRVAPLPHPQVPFAPPAEAH